MFCFLPFYFQLVGLFDWGYVRTQFFSVSRNRYGFILAGYQNGKSATDPALSISTLIVHIEDRAETKKV